MIKLCYLVTEDWYFCSHRLDLATSAINSGFDVSVIVRVNEHGEDIRQAGVRLLPLNLSRRSTNPFNELKVIWDIYQYYKQQKPEIVHHVALKPVLYGTFAARLAGVPVIVNAFAGMGWLFTSQSFMATTFKYCLKGVSRALLCKTQIIVQNPDDYELLKRMGLKSLSLIKGAGVDINIYKYVPEPNSVPLVILTGRLLWKKGVGVFVDAARELKKKGVIARFALVGKPDDMNPSSISDEQLRQWELEEVIELWGKRNDMPDVYAQCHIVCLPSTYGEGIPKALIEAASCGRPIITSDRPGCREIVKHNENGFLVDPENLGDLTEKLELLINDSALRQSMAMKGRKMVEQSFSSNRIYGETIDLYNRLLERC